ncbi:MAG: rod shape-determining protein MreD, partial [Acidimicrobiales bacterium]|nr:rod shape-determining protein MreD [Acidimicrobiales bacterium]
MSPARGSLLIVGALTLQVCLFSRFSFDGARPDVMVLVAVMAGLVAGPDRGAILGFAAGLAFDVVLTTPLGLSALV